MRVSVSVDVDVCVCGCGGLQMFVRALPQTSVSASTNSAAIRYLRPLSAETSTFTSDPSEAPVSRYCRTHMFVMDVLRGVLSESCRLNRRVLCSCHWLALALRRSRCSWTGFFTRVHVLSCHLYSCAQSCAEAGWFDPGRWGGPVHL
jgi:hypothetical protein